MAGNFNAKNAINGTFGEWILSGEKVAETTGLKLAVQMDFNIPEFTGISKLADPDALGAERVVVKGVQFSNLILADWSAGNIGEVTYPFTFTDYEFLDMIEPE